MPNWWIGVEQGLASEVQSASRAVVRALVEVYGVSLQSLTNALGTTSASGQTVKVEASQDLVIREVLRLVPELRTVRVGSDRVLAVPVNRKTSVELHRDGGVLSVKNLGPGDTAIDDPVWESTSPRWKTALPSRCSSTQTASPIASAERWTCKENVYNHLTRTHSSVAVTASTGISPPLGPPSTRPGNGRHTPSWTP